MYPLEEFGILLGEILSDGVLVKDVYFPPDRSENASREQVDVCMDWYGDAEDWSEKKGERMTAVGDVHSHCYKGSEDSDHNPSAEDWSSALAIHACVPSYCVFGICRVVNRSGKKRASIRLWPVTQPVETIMVVGEEDGTG